MKKVLPQERFFLAWANLIDLGFNSLLYQLKKQKSKEGSLKELKRFILRNGENHFKVLYKTLKKLR